MGEGQAGNYEAPLGGTSQAALGVHRRPALLFHYDDDSDEDAAIQSGFGGWDTARTTRWEEDPCSGSPRIGNVGYGDSSMTNHADPPAPYEGAGEAGPGGGTVPELPGVAELGPFEGDRGLAVKILVVGALAGKEYPS